MLIHSTSYAIPYVILFYFLLFARQISVSYSLLNIKKYNKYLFYTVILVLISFIGLRGFVYTDWYNYYPLYKSAPSVFDPALNDFLFKERFVQIEIGFLLFCVISKSFLLNYEMFILVNTLFDLGLVVYFINKYNNNFIIFSLIFFFVFSGIELSFNLLRNFKAITLFLISIKHIERKKFFPFLILNVIGYLFHSSAIIFIIMYFLLRIKFNSKIILILFIIGNFVYLTQLEYIKPVVSFITSLIGGRIQRLSEIYFDLSQGQSNYGISLGYIERSFSFILIFLLRDKLFADQKRSNIFLNGFYIYIFIHLYLSEINVFLQRLPVLFAFSYWIIYPRIYNSMANSFKKIIFIYVLLLYGTLKLVTANDTFLSKYDNVLFHHESYESRAMKFELFGERAIGKK